MDELISDLLELSRAGRTEMRLAGVDMTGTAQAVYNEIATPEVLKSFEFRLSSLPPAEADLQLIRRVWGNLISNAIKYTLPMEKRVIEVSGYKDDDFNVYSVRDTGVGFNQKYKQKLFEIFQRLHKAEDFEGSGVGLSIVQRIISRHGGRVWAEGKEGEGAVFWFSLPKKDYKRRNKK
jgi:signal transduction histidine kinase